MNRLKTALGLMAAMALLTGCVATPEVTTYIDPLTNQRTDLLSENELIVPGQTQPREIVLLNASRIPVTRNHYRISLEVQYLTRVEAGALDILPGRTLTIVTDGKEMKFSSLGSMNARKERDGILTETALYEAQPSDIDAIANASKVTVLVKGKSLLIERDFSPQNFERFKQFATKISTPGPKAGTPMAHGL